MSRTLEPIGHIRTPFSQKFGIPRQGLGVSIAKGHIEFCEHINANEACAGIDAFSHLWLVFEFHQHREQGWSQKVRPPRLGGNQKLGVFATRSSFRPNGIGMSVVKNLGLNKQHLAVEGVDLLNATPILDIKPYVAYSDSIPDANSAFAQETPAAKLSVEYRDEALKSLGLLETNYPDLKPLLENVISSDPRPAYKANKSDEKQYHVRLYDIEISFTVIQKTAMISELKQR